MKPKAFDREVMDLIFGSKINFLQNAVDGLLKVRDSNVEDDLVEALEQLEDQITGAIVLRIEMSVSIVGSCEHDACILIQVYRRY